jgi:hypothetical protein
MHTTMLRAAFVLLVLCHAVNAAAADNEPHPPFADIHLHYNWDHEELVAPEQAIQILQDHYVTLAVVFSTPTPNALKLTSRPGLRVIHFFSPYISAYRRSGWFYDKEVVPRARAGLQNKTYAGIGEVHVVSGIGPRRDNKVLQGLLQLAAEFNVPFNIHTEASSHLFFKPLCQQYPNVRFLWAHAGGILAADEATKILKVCPNVWMEVSAKDPWHYGGLVDDQGKLRDAWKTAFIQYPDRFMVGTDPVWHAHQRDRWYEADEGWLHYQQFINFHRKWLAQLPDAVEKKIRLDNAMHFFAQTRN